MLKERLKEHTLDVSVLIPGLLPDPPQLDSCLGPDLDGCSLSSGHSLLDRLHQILSIANQHLCCLQVLLGACKRENYWMIAKNCLKYWTGNESGTDAVCQSAPNFTSKDEFKMFAYLELPALLLWLLTIFSTASLLLGFSHTPTVSSEKYLINHRVEKYLGQLTVLILLSVHSIASSLASLVTSSDASAIALAMEISSFLLPLSSW